MKRQIAPVTPARNSGPISYLGLDPAWFGKGVDVVKIADSTEVIYQSDEISPEHSNVLRRADTVMNTRDVVRLGMAFLTDEQILWRSPLDDAEVPFIGCIAFGNNRSLFFFGGENPCTMVVERSRPNCLYYHRQHLALAGPRMKPRNCTSAARKSVRAILRFMRANREDILSYFYRAEAGTLQRMIVIGDHRPAHFFSQSLNTLVRDVAGRLNGFAAMGGQAIVLKDCCFIDPVLPCPKLAEIPRFALQSTELASNALKQGFFCKHYVRMGSDRDFSVVCDFLGTKGPRTRHAEHFLAWIVLDLEKKRFANQVRALGAVVREMSEIAGRRGLPLKIYWDGWTISQGEPSEKDRTILAHAAETLLAIRSEAGVTFEEEELFRKDLVEKVALAREADVAINSYGTAFLISSIIAGVPSVAYGLKKMLQKVGYISDAQSIVITEPAVSILNEESAQPDHWVFEVRESELVFALHQLLAPQPMS
ncbi:hypothetical protein [Roseomonas sp. WA12]